MGYTHGIRWSENKIETEILKVMNMLSINRMPSAREIEEVLGDSKLTNAISKRGGHYYWAKKLNVKIKESDTKTGIDFENIAIKLFESKGYVVKSMPLLHPYDLLINDFVKVDVKISNPGYVRTSRVHTFRTAKKDATCDLYILFAMDENGGIERLFIIPGFDLRVVTLCIGSNSKYNKYINRWDLVGKYIDFYSELNNLEEVRRG